MKKSYSNWSLAAGLIASLFIFSCGGDSASVCGDGLVDMTEACDDGNTATGDGCTAACTVETGFDCQGAPSTCVTTCGDGAAAGAEGCDDGNTADGDGCDASCAVESGYVCLGMPSVCSPDCGDGAIVGTEVCDDGNTLIDDGCSDTCTIENGWDCQNEPSVCTSVCGDGAVAAGAEECDDGNTATGDGCDDLCAAEPGWLCTGEPSTCDGICGDGVVVSSEGCDDMNTATGDGCDDLCAVEAGYFCTGEPSVCQLGGILLMGDDVLAPGWDAFRAALTASGVAWDEVDLITLPFPTATELAPYTTLIWFEEDTLAQTNANAQLVVDWLGLGGRSLFVTNVDFMWDMENGAMGSGENNLYLTFGSTYVGDFAGAGIATIDGVLADPISADFVSPNGLMLSQNGDSNGDYADETMGPATQAGIYGAGGTGSGRSGLSHYDTGNYKVVWLGVNFHNGLVDATQRNLLMDNILTYFGL